MPRLLARPWIRIAIAAIALFVCGGLYLCWHFDIWSWRDWQIYQLMSNECHPVWTELHERRIFPGQSVDEVIAKTNPVRVTAFEDVTWLEYQKGLCFTGVTVTARNGRLVRAEAWSCTWQRIFFDEWPATDQETFWKRYSDHMEPRWKALEAKLAAQRIQDKKESP